jgi:carboxylate-amine ligase
MRFQPSDGFTVGMEMELQLLDRKSLDLADAIVPVMKLFPGASHIKPEFIQDSVEVTSEVCNGAAALERGMRRRVGDLLAGCASLDMRLAGAGTHPFSRRLAVITPTPRYRALEARSGGGYFVHTQIVFATHVHLGMPDGDEAIRVMNELKPYLPVLLAISANSPFWREYDTGFAAYRHRILAASRSYGQPPNFADWSAFETGMELLERAGVIQGINDVHWDLRPRPALGTLEVRVMDAQPTVRHAIELAAFIRALVRYLRTPRDVPADRPLRPAPWWIQKDNGFMASRLGRQASLIIDPDGRTMPLQHVLVRIFDQLAGDADALGEHPYLDALRQRCETGLDYEHQRAVNDRSGSLRDVVESLASALEREQRLPVP